MTERWLPVAGFEQYEVSSLGRVRSLDTTVARVSKTGRRYEVPWRGKLLALTSDKDGYLQVGLGRARKAKVHVLVLEAFVGQRPAGTETRHSNNVRHDNRLSNLSWATHATNEADKMAAGTREVKGSRTACLRGHAYTPENTYFIPSNGNRLWRTCQRARQKVTP